MKKAIFILATLLVTLPAIAASNWEACEKKVMKNLIAKGEREYGNPGAYIGVGGAGAEIHVVKICGYKPMKKKNCDDIYINTYLSCREGEFISEAERSYIRYYDPKVLDADHLEALCKIKDRITRKEFGNMMCGER